MPVWMFDSGTTAGHSRARMRVAGSVAAVALAASGLVLGPAGPAMADHNQTHRDQRAACTALGGQFGGTNTSNATCTVVTTVDGPAVPSGAPTTTSGPSEDVGEPTSVDSAPVRQPDPEVETFERDAGEATSVTTYRRGTPVVTEEDRDAGEATSVSVIVAGTPTSTTRTERGESTTTETPTTTNCRRVNNENSKKPVERCERAVLYTTTTPTTVITTTTTPRERVTTTIQPRETVVTTTTPVTEVITTTQPRESCTTTTYQTLIITTTTQRRQHTETTSQPTTITTTTTTTRYTYNGTTPVLAGTPQISTTTRPGDPIVTSVPVEDEPEITTSTRPGPEESDTVCTPAEPVITSEDGETTQDVHTATVSAEPVVTVTREDIDPLVVEIEAPGAPIVDEEVRSTGETCYNNPSTAQQRRNRC